MSTYIKISQNNSQIKLRTANYVMAQEINENLILPEVREELKKKHVVLYECWQELELVIDTKLVKYNFKDIIWGELNIKLEDRVQPINVVGLHNLLSNTFVEKPLEIIIVSPEVKLHNSEPERVKDPKKREILQKLSKINFGGGRRNSKPRKKLDTSAFIKTRKERNTVIKCIKCGKTFEVPGGTVIKEYTCYKCSTIEGYMPEPSIPGRVPFARFNINNVIHFNQRSYSKKKRTSLEEDVSLLKYMLKKKRKK